MYEANALYLLYDDLQWIVNSRNKDGASAIHFAAGDGSVSRMQLLCNAGLYCLLSSILPFISVIPIMDEQSKCATKVLTVRHFDMICRCKHDLQELLRIYLALGGWKRASCRNQGNKRCINVDFNYLCTTDKNIV